MKILIAYDGSDCANTAIDDLVRAGLPAHVEAMLVTVAEVWAPEPPENEYDQDDLPQQRTVLGTEEERLLGGKAIDEAQEVLGHGINHLRRLFPEWHLRGRVLTDSPATGVLRAASGFNPDLIVVGSHGRSALGRFILGSVSQKVLYEALCSVRIARSHPPVPDAPARIVVGIDGTPDSIATVEEIAERRWPEGSSVRVISAIGYSDITLVPPVGVGVPVAITEAVIEQRTWLSTAVEQAKTRLTAAGLHVTGVVMEAAPIPTILDEAENWGADVIFVGARGHSFMQRFLLGSVSSAIAARAGCSVEVVRRR